MKKYVHCIFAFFLIFMATSPGFGQFSNFSVGILGGLNLSNVNENPEELLGVTDVEFDKNVRTTLGGGLMVNYAVSPALSIDLRALYQQKGAEYEATQVQDFVGIVDIIVTDKLEYFNFPLNIKYAFSGGDNRPYLFAGPDLAVLLSANVDISVEPMVVNEAVVDTSIDVKDDYQTVDAGIQFGGGIEFPVAGTDAFLELGYSLGITPRNNEGEKDVRNNVAFLKVGVVFGK